MNRRAFLLSLGMIAWSSPATTTKTTRRKPKPKPTRQAAAPHGGNVDLLLVVSQVGASKLAFHGDVLVHSVGDELRRWNATTMQRTDTRTDVDILVTDVAVVGASRGRRNASPARAGVEMGEAG